MVLKPRCASRGARKPVERAPRTAAPDSPGSNRPATFPVIEAPASLYCSKRRALPNSVASEGRSSMSAYEPKLFRSRALASAERGLYPGYPCTPQLAYSVPAGFR